MEEKIKLLLEEFEKNEKWFSKHYEELEREHGSKFFAIADQRVLAVEEEFEKLLDVVREKNIDIDKVFFTSIPPKGVASIL